MENRKQKEENEMEIDLVSLFFYLIDKWKLLFLGAVVGVVLAGALVFFQTPMYESSSTLYVLSKTTSITSITDLQVGTELTSDFSVIATSKPVIDGAIKTLKKDNIKLTRKEIKKMLTVANKTDTRMLSITVTSDDAKLSCASGRCHYRCGSGSDGEHHTDRSAYHCRTSGSRICAGRQRHDEKTGHGHCARNLPGRHGTHDPLYHE